MNGLTHFQARLSETLRLAIIYRLAHELNADLSSADVLRHVLHAAAEALATPHASIAALREGTLVAAYALGAGGHGNAQPVMQRMLDEGLAGFVVHNFRTVIVNDITSNPLWITLPGEPLSPQTGSALCLPLIHSGAVVGVMTLTHPATSYFTADAVNLTNTISEMGAAALTNALLLEDAQQARLRYQHLFDDVIVPIIITDLQGNIQETNQRVCEILGYAQPTLKHKSLATLHHAESNPLKLPYFEQVKNGAEVRFQSLAVTKDGKQIPVQVYAKRINGPNANRIQWIEHDISSQLELEQLRQDLSAMVYHDMRGPLGNVYTSLQALQRLLADHPNPNVGILLSLAAKSERQARRMVDSLLDVYRLEEGNKLLNRAQANLHDIVKNVVDHMRSLAEENRVFLRFALADDLPQLYIDAEMVERVIINLVENAIKYSPEGGRVTISTATSGSEVYVRVKDTGPGIPAEAQIAIFDKFARVTQRHMPKGVGLGLAFCKLAVEAHGGRIWVKSAKRQGSTFTLALPVEAPATKELPGLGTAVLSSAQTVSSGSGKINEQKA